MSTHRPSVAFSSRTVAPCRLRHPDQIAEHSMQLVRYPNPLYSKVRVPFSSIANTVV